MADMPAQDEVSVSRSGWLGVDIGAVSPVGAVAVSVRDNAETFGRTREDPVPGARGSDDLPPTTTRGPVAPRMTRRTGESP